MGLWPGTRRGGGGGVNGGLGPSPKPGGKPWGAATGRCEPPGRLGLCCGRCRGSCGRGPAGAGREFCGSGLVAGSSSSPPRNQLRKLSRYPPPEGFLVGGGRRGRDPGLCSAPGTGRVSSGTGGLPAKPETGRPPLGGAGLPCCGTGGPCCGTGRPCCGTGRLSPGGGLWGRPGRGGRLCGLPNGLGRLSTGPGEDGPPPKDGPASCWIPDPGPAERFGPLVTLMDVSRSGVAGWNCCWWNCC